MFYLKNYRNLSSNPFGIIDTNDNVLEYHSELDVLEFMYQGFDIRGVMLGKNGGLLSHVINLDNFTNISKAGLIINGVVKNHEAMIVGYRSDKDADVMLDNGTKLSHVSLYPDEPSIGGYEKEVLDIQTSMANLKYVSKIKSVFTISEVAKILCSNEYTLMKEVDAGRLTPREWGIKRKNCRGNYTFNINDLAKYVERRYNECKSIGFYSKETYIQIVAERTNKTTAEVEEKLYMFLRNPKYLDSGLKYYDNTDIAIAVKLLSKR